MDALLTAIMIWLSANYGLPEADRLPGVRFAPPLEIAFLHHQAFTGSAQARAVAAYEAVAPGERREVVSAYDTRRGVILLPDGWTPGTPAALSMLVHEMVHHLQTAAGRAYACPGEREKLAYEAQDKWLAQFGTDLEREFRIDGFTLLASTTCGM